MSTVKIQYVGKLTKVRMPEGCEYLTKEEAKTKEAQMKTVLKGQPVKASPEAAKGLIASKLWEQAGKNGAPKKGGRKQ